MKYGSWTLELAKGKPSIEIASSEALIKALESIKAAVEAGELDEQIDAASAGLRGGFKKYFAMSAAKAQCLRRFLWGLN